jgi:hypothetical protein
MQFKVFEPGIELYGRALVFMLDGFRIAPSVAMKYLVKFGIARPGPGGEPMFDADAWHSQEAALKVFEAIHEEIGPNSMFEVGRQVGAQGPVSKDSRDIHQAVLWIDTGYHLYHRKNGEVMFDAATSRMMDGIGHYGYRRDGDRAIAAVCANPYPCAFDHGLVTGLAMRYQPRVRVDHDEAAPCRKNGADSCTYLITW